MTWGKISASANSRTDLRRWTCSGVYSKSTALYDLFPGGVPVHGALFPVALHGHAAGYGHAEAKIERAVRLRARIADGVEEVLHVGAGIGLGHTHHFVAVRPGLLLGCIADGLHRVGGRAVVAEDLFRHRGALIAKPGIPGEEHLVVLHRHAHGIGHLAAILPKVEAARHGHRLRN